MRLEIVQDWPRSPTQLATITQVRQAPSAAAVATTARAAT